MDGQHTRSYVDTGLAGIAGKISISPNTITVFALLVMVLAAGLVFSGNLTAAGLLILVSGILDLFDGAVARATSRETSFGALLDRVADRTADFSILAAIILGGHVDLRLGLYVLLTILLASYISACLEAATQSACGKKMSLRAVRIILLAVACLAGRIPEAMLLLALIGTYAVGMRLLVAYRTLG